METIPSRQILYYQTNHKSLKELLQQVIQKLNHQAYLCKLLGYNFRIEYKTGSSNKVVDALSRQFEDQSSLFLVASLPIADFLSILHEENSSLPDLQLLHK